MKGLRDFPYFCVLCSGPVFVNLQNIIFCHMKITRLLLFTICIFAILPLKAQDTVARPDIPVDEETRLITWKQVIQQQGNTDELYVRAIAWLNKFFKNPAEVTRTRDRENGLLKGVHRFKLYYTDKDGFKRETGLCEYDFSIECREGRYRYILTNFVMKEMSRKPVERWLDRNDPAWNPQWNSYLQQIADYVKSWEDSLNEAMAPPIKKDDSW